MNIFILARYFIMLVGLSGLEPPTSRLSGARSNLLSYKPIFPGVLRFLTLTSFFSEKCWWRWWDSNPWPPACRAGALPTELHPHWCVCALFLQWTFEERECTAFSKDRERSFMIILQNWTTNKICTPNLVVLGYDSILEFTQNSIEFCQFSIERRWSSRTFRYGYLVTT